MVATEVLRDPALSHHLGRVFGRFSDPMTLVERRAQELLPELRTIVWEGDPETFQFSYVGQSAEDILGYPARRWTTEPTFWADTVVHEDDRRDAVAYCALATGKCKDHDFVYRAVAADGRVVWLHDVVRVCRSPSGIAERLRGIMIDVTDSVR